MTKIVQIISADGWWIRQKYIYEGSYHYENVKIPAIALDENGEVMFLGLDGTRIINNKDPAYSCSHEIIYKTD